MYFYSFYFFSVWRMFRQTDEETNQSNKIICIFSKGGPFNQISDLGSLDYVLRTIYPWSGY